MLTLPSEPALRGNEKVFVLQEYNARTGDLREEHRWQVITVSRNGRQIEFPRSLGPSKNFEGVGEILIISDYEDSVDMVMDTADAMRSENQIADFLAEKAEESTLIEDAYKHFDERRSALTNKTHFSNASGKMNQRTGLRIRR